MSVLVDKKFLGFISLGLDKFKQKDQYTWNSRCPFCGDSKKSASKARFYIFQKGGKDYLIYHCHNCNKSGKFSELLKLQNPSLYGEYLLESFGNTKKEEEPKGDLAKESFPKFKTSINLPTIEELGNQHPAYNYLQNRKILKKYFTKWYYASDFKNFVLDILPETTKELKENDRRIIIPFYDENKNLLGFQGRAIYKTDVRYISIKLFDSAPKIWGLDQIDFSKRVYVFEGPIDASFFDNSVAALDSALYNVDEYLKKAEQVTYVFDNEPRNKDIIKSMRKTIDLGYNICFWPKDIEQKDVNDMVLAGENISILQHIIDENTFSGLRAKLELQNWSKS